jgi:hypothetical protein
MVDRGHSKRLRTAADREDSPDCTNHPFGILRWYSTRSSRVIALQACSDAHLTSHVQLNHADAESARQASEEHLRAADALLMQVQSPRGGLAAASPRSLSPRPAQALPRSTSSPRLQLSPRPSAAPASPRNTPSSPPPTQLLPPLLNLPLPSIPRTASPLPSPRMTPTSPLRQSPRVAPTSPLLSPHLLPTSPLQSPRMLPTAVSPLMSPHSTPRSPTARRPRPWEDEDRIVCERAMDGVRKALRVLELLSSADARAHAKVLSLLSRRQ